MAVTAGYMKPIKPYTGGAGNGRSALMSLPVWVADSQTIEVGDVLIYNGSGKVVEDNTAPAPAVVAGISQNALTTTTATDEDFVICTCAIPGQVFEANIFNGTSDEVGLDFTGQCIDTKPRDIDIPATDTLPGINVAVEDAGACASIIGPSFDQWTPTEGPGRPIDTNTSTGLTNMRVMFVFQDSVFMSPQVGS